jgi:hypothetical protein
VVVMQFELPKVLLLDSRAGDRKSAAIPLFSLGRTFINFDSSKNWRKFRLSSAAGYIEEIDSLQ